MAQSNRVPFREIWYNPNILDPPEILDFGVYLENSRTDDVPWVSAGQPAGRITIIVGYRDKDAPGRCYEKHVAETRDGRRLAVAWYEVLDPEGDDPDDEGPIHKIGGAPSGCLDSIVTPITYYLYRGPNNVIICNPVDRETGAEIVQAQEEKQPPIHAIIRSNYGAVQTMHNILDSKRGLHPVEAPKEQGAFWAGITTAYAGNKTDGTLYEIKAEHEHDFTVRAAFSVSEDGEWEALPIPTGRDFPSTNNVSWRLYYNKVDGSETYLENITNQRWYQLSPEFPDIGPGGDRLSNRTRSRQDKRAVQRVLETSYGHTWKYARCLDNDRRNAHLHVCVSEENEIKDRVEIKWFEFGDTLSNGLNEMRAHRQLHGARSPYIIGWRGYSVRREDVFVPRRMFLEFASFGSLDDLAASRSQEMKRLPPMFIWILFRNMVSACQTIEECNYVHADLKFENIFIKDCPAEFDGKTDDYAAYTLYTPVVGDFDFMYHLNEDIRRKFGTPGRLVPETRDVKNSNPPVNVRPTKLHTYSIGLLIWCLMRGKKDGLYTKRETGPKTKIIHEIKTQNDAFPQTTQEFFPAEPAAQYPANLRNLVQRCMEINPDRRPTLAEVAAEIEDGLQEMTKTVADLNSGEGGKLPDWWTIESREDRFTIGTTFKRRRAAT